MTPALLAGWETPMLQRLLAYVVAILLGLAVGALIEFVCFAVFTSVFPARENSDSPSQTGTGGSELASTLASMAGAIVAVWCAQSVLGWFRTDATTTLAWVLGAAYVLNDLRRVAGADERLVGVGMMRTIGDVCGVALGASLFLKEPQ